MLGGIGQFCVTEALRQADTAVVMPIDFFKLIWVALIAWLAFGERLDLFTWIGGAVIFASAVSIVYGDRAGGPPDLAPFASPAQRNRACRATLAML